MTHTPIDIAALEALLKANKTYVRRFSGLDDPADDLVRAVPELISEVTSLRALLAEAVEELKWYAEQTEDCRRLTSAGEIARHALDNDGGKRAHVALAAIQTAMRDARLPPTGE